MARLRAKEAAARDAFRSAVERYVPGPVLAGLGLTTRPPHCVVSVPPADAGLAVVTPDDLRLAPPAQQVCQPLSRSQIASVSHKEADSKTNTLRTIKRPPHCIASGPPDDLRRASPVQQCSVCLS